MVNVGNTVASDVESGLDVQLDLKHGPAYSRVRSRDLAMLNTVCCFDPLGIMA